MEHSPPVDGFRLAYDRPGTPGAPPVLLLHGWPGDRHDWREVAARLGADCDVLMPDLRGFGDSDALAVSPTEGYTAVAQARSLLALLDELGLQQVVVAGYDVGSRVAQRLARDAPQRLRGLVLAPPLPGVGERVLGPDQMREFWYQAFHDSDLPRTQLDGRPDAVHGYLRHFWSHWSGPGFVVDETELDRLTALYARPGRLLSSIAWYRAGSGTVASSLSERTPAREDRTAVPTCVLWPQHDPLFPAGWSDRLDEFFTDATLEPLAGVGHFSPLEAPDRLANAIATAAGVA